MVALTASVHATPRSSSLALGYFAGTPALLRRFAAPSFARSERGGEQGLGVEHQGHGVVFLHPDDGDRKPSEGKD